MKKYTCTVCGWVYDEAAGDPDNGIAPGTKWEDLPEDFVCPLCGVGKDQFEERPDGAKKRTLSVRASVFIMLFMSFPARAREACPSGRACRTAAR